MFGHIDKKVAVSNNGNEISLVSKKVEEVKKLIEAQDPSLDQETKDRIFDIHSTLLTDAGCLRRVIGGSGYRDDLENCIFNQVTNLTTKMDDIQPLIHNLMYDTFENPGNIWSNVNDIAYKIGDKNDSNSIYGIINTTNNNVKKILENKNYNNIILESINSKMNVTTGGTGITSAKFSKIYITLEVYPDFIKLKLLNSYSLQIVNKRLDLVMEIGQEEQYVGKFVEKYLPNLDINSEPNPSANGASFYVKLLSVGSSGKMQPLYMLNLNVSGHELGFTLAEFSDYYDVDISILEQTIILPFKERLPFY